MDSQKETFIKHLIAAGGIIQSACDSAGIPRSRYYSWRKKDPEFRTRAEEVQEMQIDFVESKLIQQIKLGDTTAIIFYLKTKGRMRGYNERYNPKDDDESLLLAEESESVMRSNIARRVKSKKAYLIKLLREQGKYTEELSMQATVTAQLMVRTEVLAEEILSDDHHAIEIEISREGNERKSINPKERLYLEFARQCQKALQALGMNVDAKERKSDNDSFGEFLKDFNKSLED